MHNPKDKSIAESLIALVNKKNQMENMEDVVSLLKYKKQIILQGPPGTGKTKLAKEIAEQIRGNEPKAVKNSTTITRTQIESVLKIGDIIPTKAGKALKVVRLDGNVVGVKTDDSQEWSPSYNKIIDSYNNQLFKILGRTGGFKPYEDAIAV